MTGRYEDRTPAQAVEALRWFVRAVREHMESDIGERLCDEAEIDIKILESSLQPSGFCIICGRSRTDPNCTHA